VTLVELPFPLAVGYSKRLGWIPKSNLAASVSGICAFHENRQLLAPWMRTFGYLSSYGISNDLDGFLSWILAPVSRSLLLWPYQRTFRRKSFSLPLESINPIDRKSFSTFPPIVVFFPAFYFPVQRSCQSWRRLLDPEFPSRKTRQADTDCLASLTNVGRVIVRWLPSKR